MNREVKLATTRLRTRFWWAWRCVCIATAASAVAHAELPLAPSRSVAFATNEGTWMSLDVSPDGQTIVFDLLGDLYTLPIAGGRAKPLSRGLSFDTQPRFSPDGSRVAFVSDRDGSDNVWFVNSNGLGATQVSHEIDKVLVSPEWTPEADAIVATRTWLTRRTPLELLLYPLGAGSRPQALISREDGIVALGAAFGHDRHQLFFAQKALSLIRPFAEIGEFQLVSLDRRTGIIHPQSDAVGGGMRPALAPDGRWLVYATRYHAGTGLRLRNLSNGDESWLVDSVTRDDQEGQHISWDLVPGYAFLPDSSALIVARGGKIWKVSVPSGALAPVPFEADVRLELGPLLRAQRRVDTKPAPLRAREILSPALSPDGRKLAFSAIGRIWVMDVASNRAHRLSDRDEAQFQPAWSADGRTVFFTTWDPQLGGHLFSVSSAGGAPRQLTRERAFYLYPTPVPGAKGLVALRMARQAWVDSMVQRGADFGPRAAPRLDLVTLDASGGMRTLVSLDGASRLHFGPQSDRIYVYQRSSFRGEADSGLITVKLDDGAVEKVVRVVVRRESGTRPVDDLLISLDGRTLLAGVDHHVYRIARANFPGPEIIFDGTSGLGITRLSESGGEEPSWGSAGKAVFSLGATIFIADAGAPAPPREISVLLTQPRPKPPGTIVLRGARLLTMRGGPDDAIEKGDLLVRGNRIMDLGATGEVLIPPDAKVLDVSGKTLMPGLVDVHAHFATVQATHPGQPWEFLAALAYGVTTVFDPSERPSMMTHADLIESGRILGPRIDTAGDAIERKDMELIGTLEDARKLLQRYGKYGGHSVVKHYASGTRVQRQWLAMAAHEQGMMITAEGNGENRLGISEVLDGFSGHEHYFTTAPLYRDVQQLLAHSGTWYTPTLLVDHGARGGEELFYQRSDVHGDPKLARFTPHPLLDRETRRRDQFWMHWMSRDEYFIPQIAQSVAAVRMAGGQVTVGGHGQRQGLGMHWEMQLFALGGLSRHEVLRAATLGGAENLGFERDLGSLEKGKLADILVLDEDPSVEIRNTESLQYVMKDGVLLDARSLDEVWPQPHARTDWKYWGADPLAAPRN